MFYKLNADNEYISSNGIAFPDGVVLSEDNKIEHEGWKWYDEEPIPVKTDFQKWEGRVDVVKSLKDQAAESPLALRPYITAWYVGAEPLLAAFISSGSDVLLTEVTDSVLPWWDMRQSAESPSPREIAIAEITPLTE